MGGRRKEAGGDLVGIPISFFHFCEGLRDRGQGGGIMRPNPSSLIARPGPVKEPGKKEGFLHECARIPRNLSFNPSQPLRPCFRI